VAGLMGVAELEMMTVVPESEVKERLARVRKLHGQGMLGG
jgi:hypothetical protein